MHIRSLVVALTPVANTPEELGAHLKRETERYAEVIRKGNITAQQPLSATETPAASVCRHGNPGVR